MIHALLPIYLVAALGASTLTVGIIKGIAEATASIVKVFSGALSDWLDRRKFLAALGYGLAAFAKPVLPLAPSIGRLMAARFVDRVGKGIRDAPRDALLADISPEQLRGASFGLRQSLDTVGAFPSSTRAPPPLAPSCSVPTAPSRPSPSARCWRPAARRLNAGVRKSFRSSKRRAAPSWASANFVATGSSRACAFIDLDQCKLLGHEGI